MDHSMFIDIQKRNRNVALCLGVNLSFQNTNQGGPWKIIQVFFFWGSSKNSSLQRKYPEISNPIASPIKSWKSMNDTLYKRVTDPNAPLLPFHNDPFHHACVQRTAMATMTCTHRYPFLVLTASLTLSSRSP
jgi:hypothetical protein